MVFQHTRYFHDYLWMIQIQIRDHSISSASPTLVSLCTPGDGFEVHDLKYNDVVHSIGSQTLTDQTPIKNKVRGRER